MRKEFNRVIGINPGMPSKDNFCKESGCNYYELCGKDFIVSRKISYFCNKFLIDENGFYYIPKSLLEKFPEILRYSRPVQNIEKP